MCGRYTLTSPSDLAARFGLGAITETRLEPRFNIAPAQLVPSVVESEEGRSLEWMRWGYKPAWMKGLRQPPINARAETLLDRPLFRGAVRRNRCIIPASGFYEWQAVPGAKLKQPWYFCLRDTSLLGFAGFSAHDAEGQNTFLIITTKANELLAPIHDRMPVILSPEGEQVWLDKGAETLEALAFLTPYPAEQMEGFAVSRAVNDPRDEGPDLNQPYADWYLLTSACRLQRLTRRTWAPAVLPR
jgi:putative SOS response-associated peptidase YedK